MPAGTDSQAGYAAEPGTTYTGDPNYAPTQGDGGYAANAGVDRGLPGDSVPAGYAPGAPGTVSDPGATMADEGTMAGAGYGMADDRVDHWNRRDEAGWGIDQEIVGYHVEATDGRIGKIDEASTAVDASYLVVDTGPWIFGKKVMLPAGMVQRVDPADELVYVNCTKEQIKGSPEFDPSSYTTTEYRDSLGRHYSQRDDYPAS